MSTNRCSLGVSLAVVMCAIVLGAETGLPSEADTRRLAELKAAIEALPAETRESAGEKLMRAELAAGGLSPFLQVRYRRSLATFALQKGDIAEAERQLHEMLEQPSEQSTIAHCARSIIEAYRQQFQYAESGRIAQDVLAVGLQDKQLSEFFKAEIASSLAVQGKHEEAAAMLAELATSANRDGATARQMERVASEYAARGEFDRYLSIMNLVLEHMPEQGEAPGFMANYAHALETNDRSEDAAQVYARLIRSFPDHQRSIDARFQLAMILADREDFALALPWFYDFLQVTQGIADDRYRTMRQLARMNIDNLSVAMGATGRTNPS